jgi:farnesyl-diphosphate farnesyltransferase
MATIDELLARTSRTFAMAVPLLPEPTRRSTCLAYLLFRISDTFEDALWSRDERRRALLEWNELLLRPDPEMGRTLTRKWQKSPPTNHAGYLELLDGAPAVLEALSSIEETARATILAHASRTALGMAEFVSRADPDGRLCLRSVEELRRYCYTVAGIVGELLTTLFLNDAPELEDESATLHENDAAFGEALQLVNVLKDQHEDAQGGRHFLPAGVPAGEIVALARRDLSCAWKYVGALERAGAPPGMIAFTSMPAELAEATLACIERDGPGAKVPRADVLAMLSRYEVIARSPRATRRAPRAGSSADSSRS